jgi:site-specific DNA-cytosine methylase
MKRILKVLIACEESQTVCKAFRALGHEAYSCDIIECSGGHPEWHIQGDALEAVNIKKWDLVIGFPPCTDLAVSGAAWFKKKRESGVQRMSIEFFMSLLNSKVERIAIENPVGIISGNYIKTHFPDLCIKHSLPIKQSQIIEPYYFGDEANKKTCLWIKGLPLLRHDQKNYSKGSNYKESPSGRRYPEWCWNTGSGCSKVRSKTFQGIADAMASQWSEYILSQETI